MDEGYYLYAIAKAGPKGASQNHGTREVTAIAGVDAFPLESFSCGNFDAFVSKVNLNEFGQESLKRNIQDMKWLERTARAHDAIEKRLSEITTIVPVRFGTVFLSLQGIYDFTQSNSQQLHALLDDLEGCDEMGVTLNIDKRTAGNYLEHEDTSLKQLAEKIEKAGSGARYLLSKKLDIAKQEKLEFFIDSLVSQASNTLRQSVKELKQSPVIPHPEDRSILYVNLACLVADKEIESFTKQAQALQDLSADVGVSVRLTGPWPPYSFCDLRVSNPTTQGDSHGR